VVAKNCGLTLIELLTTLTLLVILTTTGIPAFTNLILDLRMTAHVNRFVHGIHLAKQAAHTSMTDVALCKSMDGRQCDRSLDWRDGWIVFVNRNRDHPPRVDPGEPVLEVSPPFASGNIGANRAEFIFRPFTTRSTNGTLTFCDRRGTDRSRAVIVSYTGRPRVAPIAPGDQHVVCPD